MRVFFKKYSVVIMVGGIFLLSSISSPTTFLSKTNLTNLLRQGSIMAILSVGEGLVIISGGFDLSIGSLTALATVLCATFMRQGILLSVLITILICLGLGAVSGFVVVKAKITPFIATLGMMMVARGIAQGLTSGDVVGGVHKSFKFIGQGQVAAIPIPVFILVSVFSVTLFFLNMTPLRHVYAVGGNEEVARWAGINTGKIKLIVYILSGSIAGLAGVVFTARLGSGLPTLGIGYELNAIAAAAIGGVSLSGGEGNLTGAVIGAFGLTMISNFMNVAGVSQFLQQGVMGIIILLGVYISSRL